MVRASKLPLSLLIGILSLVAVIVFTVGITVEAQDNQQREEGQQQEGQQENQQDQQQDLEVQQPRQEQPQQNQEGEQQQQPEPRPEEEARPEPQQQEERQQQQPQDSDEVYSYVAQPGDSYTLMARKAVQTYGLINDVNLSQAQIVYAETWLTQQAGQPELEVGQEVDFQVSQVAQAVRAAQDLSEGEESMWDFYAQQVPSFNTDNVGEGSVQGASDDRRESEQQLQQEAEGDDKGAKTDGKTKSASTEAGK